VNNRNPSQTFLNEAEDLLARIEEIALELAPGEAVGEPIHQLFRAFHTLKGSGAMFGFDQVAEFTHHVETVLDQVREGRVPVSELLIQLILRARDQIKHLLEAAQNETKPPLSAGREIVSALNGLLPVDPSDESAAPAAVTAGPVQPAPDSGLPTQTFSIRFRPDPRLMASGTNPITLLDELRALGESRVVANCAAVPELTALQSDQCYLAWEILLTTARGVDAIRDVFIFVEDGSELAISPVPGGAAAAESPAPPAGVDSPRPEPAKAAPPIVPPAVTPEPSTPAKVAAVAESAEAASSPALHRKPMAKEATVRVPSERLDRLVSLVGELVMNQSRLTQVAASANVPNFNGPVEELERLVAELRDNVLGIRMMPIGATFSRFKRLVHDLSRELGKEINLVTEGEDTEIDKTVLDQLGDPLVHIMRNSIDHGIELPEVRVGGGKSRSGTIRLTAAHVGSNVVITIADDGRGIDAAAVRAKAVERGLITPEAVLTDADLRDLILRPGFSTAKQITSVSGRGVGLDVVKRQVDALRGLLSLASQPGKGTTFTLTLPLTLAIIEGLLVEIGSDRFIVPMSVVTENVELARAERSRHNGRNVVAVRGELVPYVGLREAFDIKGGELDLEKIVIARYGDERVGLVVDRVVGSHQTVIQPLGKFYRNIDLVSGATIMGDGRVALILDLAGLIRFAGQRTPSPSSQPDIGQAETN
jgi:two-component system chemotaxis sensor kinase CheA